ncbi:hypothetical protein F9222_24765 [Escherichia coli]|nr:hypothetical protein F9222_24765 [Escherichia coli]
MSVASTPGVTEQIVYMAFNGAGVRYTTRLDLNIALQILAPEAEGSSGNRTDRLQQE